MIISSLPSGKELIFLTQYNGNWLLNRPKIPYIHALLLNDQSLFFTDEKFY